MGFIRQQEERIAIQFLTWKYEKANLPLPPESEMKKKAGDIIDEAHRIARERGKNVVGIIKELAGKYLKNEPPEREDSQENQKD